MAIKIIKIPPHLTVEVEASYYKGFPGDRYSPPENAGWSIESLISTNDLDAFADWVCGNGYYIEELELLLNQQS